LLKNPSTGGVHPPTKDLKKQKQFFPSSLDDNNATEEEEWLKALSNDSGKAHHFQSSLFSQYHSDFPPSFFFVFFSIL
jgi:hypothetical protein